MSAPKRNLSDFSARYQGQTVIVTYTDPTAGNDTKLQDQPAHAASFTTGRTTWTNDSTVEPSPAADKNQFYLPGGFGVPTAPTTSDMIRARTDSTV